MFFKIRVLRNSPICTGKHLCWNLFLTSTQVFSCEYCEIFPNSFFIESLWWHLSILFLNQKQYGMVSSKTVCRSGQSTLFTIISRKCRQVFGLYLVSILMICKKTRGYIYQVASREFSFAATCSEKE